MNMDLMDLENINIVPLSNIKQEMMDAGGSSDANGNGSSSSTSTNTTVNTNTTTTATANNSVVTAVAVAGNSNSNSNSNSGSASAESTACVGNSDNVCPTAGTSSADTATTVCDSVEKQVILSFDLDHTAVVKCWSGIFIQPKDVYPSRWSTP